MSWRSSRAAAFPAAITLLVAAGCTPQPAPAHLATNDAKVVVCAPGSFTSGNECLPVKPAECPAGTQRVGDQCEAVSAIVEELKQPEQMVAALQGPNYEEAIDSRRARKAPRSRQLLITEIQSMESLFAAAPKASPDRPMIMRRLAEEYVELAAAAARDRQESSGETASKSAKIEQAAHAASAKYYTLLTNEYPKFCSSTTMGCADEALYYLSLENRALGKLEVMRKGMLQLIQQFPQSVYIGPTYFLFGELFRDEATGDPSKWALAEQAYNEAAKYPNRPTSEPALVRLAEAFDKQGKTEKAAAIRSKIPKKSTGVATPPNDSAP